MELKAKDFRIGNLVSDLNGILIKIDSIQENGFNLVGGDSFGVYPIEEIHRCKPIELTEEWVINFMFKHSGNGFYIHTGSLIELANIGDKYFHCGIK